MTASDQGTLSSRAMRAALGSVPARSGLLATELVNNGLPIHIGAALPGHMNLQTTRGYVAVFNEDLVRHYQAYLDRRRQARPAGRPPGPRRRQPLAGS